MKGGKTGVITPLKSYQGNPNDRKTVQESLEQSERVRQRAGEVTELILQLLTEAIRVQNQ